MVIPVAAHPQGVSAERQALPCFERELCQDLLALLVDQCEVLRSTVAVEFCDRGVKIHGYLIVSILRQSAAHWSNLLNGNEDAMRDHMAEPGRAD
ncbi:hypothetical protein [Nocardia huaxiensis]|uniref:hypothetical protein n=1 Tax=Nocardia huaxiensis TaxID=2755382 RepID=UPI001C66FE7E|nr:hypothetical protein [Nocardia huaxiensis]